MAIYSLFYGTLRCTYELGLSCWFFTLYTMFFCRQFPSREHVSLSVQLDLIVGVCSAVDGFKLFVVAFYDLRHVTCATVADLYIVSVEDFI